MHAIRHLGVALIFFASQLTAEESRARKPNVLFIAVDDMRVELGCYGDAYVHSPNIDRLAAEGVVFERAYCQQTVCNPSRASLLTGLRPDTLRIWDLPTHFRENQPDVVTLPQFFKQRGYTTLNVGKIFHNWRQDAWKGDPASWSEPAVLHYNSHGRDRPKVNGPVPVNHASGAWGMEARDVPDAAYYDGRVSRVAVERLGELAAQESPFFLAVGFWKPHTPFNAPKKYWDLYHRESVPIPERVTPPDNVPEIALTDARYTDGAESELLREIHHGHLAAISYVDAQIGKVVDALDRLGLRDQTIIVFWSDHGLLLGEHGLKNKTTLFELDARVPMIIDSPFHEGGARARGLVELIDLYPTLLDLCGYEISGDLEGVSLAPMLADPYLSVRSSAITQAPRPNYLHGNLPQVMGYSLRDDRYRYTEWRAFESGEPVARELYDHQVDPEEWRNGIADPRYSAVVTELEKRLNARLLAR